MILDVANIQTKEMRFKEGRTELTVDHKGKDLTFLHPSYGPDTYFNVRDSILKDGLSLPTMAETASLLHAAYNSDDKYSSEIKQLMKDRFLWSFDKNLYTPKGVYIYPEAISNSKDLEESELVKKLETGDKSIRFVPFGYKTGEMSYLELAKNAYVRALAGDEGAEKLADVADKFRNDPCLWALTSVSEPITRVSAVGSSWGFVRRLDVDGYDHGYGRDGGGGYGFGVYKGGIGTVGSN